MGDRRFVVVIYDSDDDNRVDDDVVGQHATAAMDFWKKRGRQDAGGSTKPGSSKRQRALADSSASEDSEVFAAAGSRYHQNAMSAGGATKAAGGARKATGGARKTGSRNQQYAVAAARKNSANKKIAHRSCDVQAPPPVYTVRGPNIGGRCIIDHVCIFANYMEMNANHYHKLKKQAEEYPVPAIKHYVFKMTKSSVIKGKCKMEFGKAFSKEYLNKYLEQPILVALSYNKSEEVKYVQMKKGEKETANLISGWNELVQLFKPKKGNIIVFSFTDVKGTMFHDEKARLRLVILPLDN